MENIIRRKVNVIAVPSLNYGRFSWLYKPADSKGKALLQMVMDNKKYSAPTIKGKVTPRATFAPEWLGYVTSTLQLDLVVVDAPTIPAVFIGDVIGESAENIDLSFLD